MTSTRELNEQAESFSGHLAELRSRLIYSLIAILIMTAVAYSQSEVLFNFLREPIQKYLSQGGLIFTSPMDKFLAHLKLSIACGIVFSCPFWLYQIWKFVAPGLYANEKKYSAIFILSGSLLFIIGIVFAYFLVLPATFEFLMHFGGEVDKPMIAIDSYLAFVAQVCLMFGLAFELPLVIVILGLLGVVNKKMLREKRKYAVLLLAAMSAVFTPQPDALSMIVMLIPMIILYEIAILLVK